MYYSKEVKDFQKQKEKKKTLRMVNFVSRGVTCCWNIKRRSHRLNTLGQVVRGIKVPFELSLYIFRVCRSENPSRMRRS